MSTKTIVSLVLMLGFMALLLVNFGQEVGGYMTFVEAESSKSRAHVVGTWVEEQQFAYDRNSNQFSFHMADEQGSIKKVVYNNPMPANFTDAEKVVVEGSIDKDVFVAEHILIKCPSKYNETRGLETAS